MPNTTIPNTIPTALQNTMRHSPAFDIVVGMPNAASQPSALLHFRCGQPLAPPARMFLGQVRERALSNFQPFEAPKRLLPIFPKLEKKVELANVWMPYAPEPTIDPRRFMPGGGPLVPLYTERVKAGRQEKFYKTLIMARVEGWDALTVSPVPVEESNLGATG